MGFREISLKSGDAQRILLEKDDGGHNVGSGLGRRRGDITEF